ncbi:MAG: replication-relaxation family protein [Methylocystaceae bacterium]|nr:replication-relaxation family protein [Methylocystaceae bacterium]
MMIKTLTETEFAILQALRTYRYLTAAQLLRIGVSKNKSRLYTVLRSLTSGKRPFVAKMKHGVMPGRGRIPDSHYLTKRGAALLAEALCIDSSEVAYPKSTIPIRTHFFHRLHCIDCEITVRLWAEKNDISVDYYHSYFDVTGANRGGTTGKRRALTKIDLKNRPGLIPDASFQLTWPDGTARLFLLEVHNQNRSKRITDKLAEYRFAIGDGAINKQFDYPHAPRILTIFENEKWMHLALQRMRESGLFDETYAPFFFLNTLEGIESNFKDGWFKIVKNKKTSLY